MVESGRGGHREAGYFADVHEDMISWLGSCL